MFRDMRRWKQQLTEAECVEVLQAQPRGILAVHGEDGYPYAVPMDFLYRDGKLYFHCAKQGHKLDAIQADSRVSFCVMDEGFRKDGEWALNIKSVVIFGKMEKLNEPSEDLLFALGAKYYPTAEAVTEEIRKAADRVQLLSLTIDHMTGKLVNES